MKQIEDEKYYELIENINNKHTKTNILRNDEKIIITQKWGSGIGEDKEIFKIELPIKNKIKIYRIHHDGAHILISEYSITIYNLKCLENRIDKLNKYYTQCYGNFGHVKCYFKFE